MCRINNHEIKDLSYVKQMTANRILTEALTVINKAGGKKFKSDLQNMSFEHLICLCSMNQITITFK